MDFPRKSYAAKNVSRSSAVGVRLSLDPKLFADKTNQLNCQKEIISYFQENIPEIPLNLKHLKAPSTKDFQDIFTTLVSRIDPNYLFTGRLDEDVPNFFKSMGYPYAISKNSLLAVGAPNSWPSLLAALAWLIDLVKLSDGVSKSEDANYKINQDEVTMENLPYLYIKLHEIWYYNGNITELEEDIIRIQERSLVEKNALKENLENINACLKAQKNALKLNKNDFISCETRATVLKSHILSTKNINSNFQNEIRGYEDRCNSALKTQENLKRFILEGRETLEYLMSIVKNQTMTVDESEHMEEEMKSLDVNIANSEDQRKRYKELQRDCETRLFAQITEATNRLEKISNSSGDIPFVNEKLKFSLVVDNLGDRKKTPLEPSDILEKVKNFSNMSMLALADNTSKNNSEISSLIMKCLTKKEKIDDLNKKIQEKLRDFDEKCEAWKKTNENIMAIINDKDQEIVSIEGNQRSERRAIEDLQCKIKILEENIEQKKKFNSKCEIEWKNAQNESKNNLKELLLDFKKLMAYMRTVFAKITEWCELEKIQLAKIKSEYFQRNAELLARFPNIFD